MKQYEPVAMVNLMVVLIEASIAMAVAFFGVDWTAAQVAVLMCCLPEPGN